MTTEGNKARYSQFIQSIFNEGKFDELSGYLAPSYQIKDAPPGAPQGAEGVRAASSMFRSAFPDLEITLDSVIAEGDTVAARSTVRGTHNVPFFGIAPTGKQVSVTSLTMVRIVDGRLVESWVKTDTAGLMSQLGAGAPA